MYKYISSHKQKLQAQVISLEFCQTFKNYTMPVLHRTLPENWRTGHTSQFILEDSIAMLLKADKDITRK